MESWKIRNQRWTLVLFLLNITLSLPPTELRAETPKYWECSNRVGGEWDFGRAPMACEVYRRQEPLEVRTQYTPLVFMDALGRTSERQRYMTGLHAFLREVGARYIKRRKPSVSANETDAFVLGLLALAHQETYWSHYRISTDEVVRYMRGDSGHGHGIMQVDDRSHYAALLEGKGIDLFENVLYGLDVFYDRWQRAVSASCVASPTHFVSRTRAAWSAYNGGPGSICRWTNPNSRYAKHDISFRSKLSTRGWLQYVTNPNATTTIDVECMMEGQRPCPLSGQTPGPTEPRVGDFVRSSNLETCVLKPETLHCVPDARDVSCLEAHEGRMVGQIVNLDKQRESQLTKRTVDRHALCETAVSGLIKVTKNLKLLKNINLRSTPGGALIGTLATGSGHTILDFEVRDGAKQLRYYKVRTKIGEGYVYAGDRQDYSQWAIPGTSSQSVDRPIQELAKIGNWIEINNLYGINLRATPGGTLLTTVPRRELLQVMDTVVRGNENKTYYQVRYQNHLGFIYTGTIHPLSTLGQWTKPANPAATDAKSLATLKQGITYRYLRDCGISSCAYSDAVVNGHRSGGLAADSLEVLATSPDGLYQKVVILRTGQQGWIHERDLQVHQQ